VYDFVGFQSIFQRRPEVLFCIGPFQYGRPHSANSASFLKGPERVVGFMEDNSQETEIEGIIAERKRFRIGHLKMSLRNKSAGGLEHPLLKIDSPYIQTEAGESLGENAAARSNVENSIYLKSLKA
jgi:hypothetical protein